MDKIKTSDADFIAALEAEVKEAGSDFVYPRTYDAEGFKTRCVYVRDGQASCLIGRVLHRLGADIEELAELDRSLSNGASYAIPEVVYGISRRLLLAASTAQAFQDRGCEWGEALERFHEYYGTDKG